MKISVVTISYNQAEFLTEAIESVLAQRSAAFDVEYIVVDPGSKDESRDIVNRYGDQIAHRIFEPDKGPSDGLNKGFARATGDILCYLNADDSFEPGAFAKVVDFFAKHPDVEVVYGHGNVIDRHGQFIRRVWSDTFSLTLAAYGLCVTVQPSTFIRREAYVRTSGFNLANRSSWDGELMIDMVMAGARTKKINAFLSNYRLHGESITNSGKLIAIIEQDRKVHFKRIKGRDFAPSDTIVRRALRYVKHLSSPRVTWERIAKGPVFNRGMD